MTIDFTIRDWSAFASGLCERNQWIAWAAEPFLPQGDAHPALAEMVPMQRRRVDKLGRLALQVAWWCQPDPVKDCPLVFASRHGDLPRTYEMLRTLAQDEPLSPTQFGLSTHNAISAQYSIARHLVGNCVCVSAGDTSAEAAVIEALGLLADGEDEVLVVVYEGPVPADYAEFVDDAQIAFAWTARLGRARTGDVGCTLQVSGDPGGLTSPASPMLPHALEVLRFLVGDQAALEHRENGRIWRWLKHV